MPGPSRTDVVTYRVRVDIDGARPPIWRRLEVASDLTLDVVHAVLQDAFGWDGSHLHKFSVGTQRHGWDTEYFLTSYDVDEGDDEGVPEWQVRLDQVLADVGDRMYYEYDFGDDWAHTLRLEAVEPRAADAPRAVCTGGRRAGPYEDIGGIAVWNEVVVAVQGKAPADNEWIAETLEWLPDDVDPAAFSVAETNEQLGAAGYGMNT